MTLNIENEYEKNIPIDYESLAVQVVEAALDYEKCPYEAELTLILTNDDEIRKTNNEFRSIDRATDVLSFPMIPFQSPADYAIIEEMGNACFNPDTGELLLGDIMISIPRMQEQAHLYGHGQAREFAFLIAHSILHLLGYDHMQPEEAVCMEQKQEEILNILEIKR